MKFCAGIDLGGTKIETRLLDQNFNEQSRKQIETPVESYSLLLDGILEQLNWVEQQAPNCPIVLASAGIIDPISRKTFAANLPFDQEHFETDIAQKFGRFVPLLNDSNAFAQSEANFKDTQKFNNVVGLIIGTRVAAGQVFSQSTVLEDANGEWGVGSGESLAIFHFLQQLLPNMISRYLIVDVGRLHVMKPCLAGPGLVKLAKVKFGADTTTYQIFSDKKYSPLLDIWFDVLSDLLAMIAKTNDPEVIVFGGGLGTLPIVPERTRSKLERKLLPGVSAPKLFTAQGGDASGARGAAIYALNQANEKT